MLEKGLYICGKKKSYRDGFVKNGNERCGHTECCDIKRGLVMAMGQAVSRPSIEHTIFIIIINQQTVWTAVRSTHYPVIL